MALPERVWNVALSGTMPKTPPRRLAARSDPRPKPKHKGGGAAKSFACLHPELGTSGCYFRPRPNSSGPPNSISLCMASDAAWGLLRQVELTREEAGNDKPELISLTEETANSEFESSQVDSDGSEYAIAFGRKKMLFRHYVDTKEVSSHSSSLLWSCR